jgi:hypothetical protein
MHGAAHYAYGYSSPADRGPRGRIIANGDGVTKTVRFDSGNSASHWTELMRPGQYALFVFDTRTRTPRNPDGSVPGPEGRSLAILDSREEAVALANDLVSLNHALYCEIYGHAGEYGLPLETIRDTAFRDKYFRSRARKELTGGLILFVCGVILAAIDFHRDLQWIWGYVLGLKCMTVGTILMVAGAIGLRKERSGDNRQRI